MLWWELLTSAVLGAAARTGPAPLTVGEVDSRELLSVQDISAVVRRVTAMEVCFEVQRSLRYWSAGATSGKLDRGDNECVRLEDEASSTKHTFVGLADGDLVRLRRSYFWIVLVVEHNGFRIKESTFTRPVEVLKVGAEVSRRVKAIQRVAAKYEGSTKLEGAHMVAATGVDSSSGELACLKVESEINYMSVPVSDTVEGKLYKDERFCIHFEEQKSTTLATIRGCAVGDVVTVVLASEMVEYKWKNGAGETESDTEWDFKFDLKIGRQNDVEILKEEATVIFDGVEAVSTWDGDYAMRFCFKTVETGEERTVCFLNTLQLVATQVKFLAFTPGKQMHLRWRKCNVSFITDDATHTQTAATEENLILSIGMGEATD